MPSCVPALGGAPQPAWRSSTIQTTPCGTRRLSTRPTGPAASAPTERSFPANPFSLTFLPCSSRHSTLPESMHQAEYNPDGKADTFFFSLEVSCFRLLYLFFKTQSTLAGHRPTARCCPTRCSRARWTCLRRSSRTCATFWTAKCMTSAVWDTVNYLLGFERRSGSIVHGKRRAH